MKYPIRTIALAVALLGMAGGLAALLSKQAQAAPAAAPAAQAALTVELVQPSQVRWPQTLQASGALAPWQEASISAETGGLRIVALHADVGSQVKRGQLLAELASATLGAERRQAEANVAQARASLQEAQANARRGEAVRESGALSNQQIEQYQLSAASAEASLAASEAALASARIKLAQTRILAVDDGVVSSRSAVLGAVVSSGTELFRLVRQGKLEWQAELSAEQLARLKPGLRGQISLPGGDTVRGTLRLVAPTLSSSTRHALAYVALEAHPKARAGMYARGSIALGEQTVLTVPSSAVTVRDGHSYVFEVDAQGKVIQHQVQTGRRQDSRIEIVSGVAAKARLVRSGGAFLNDGETVRLAAAGKEAA